ncbi:lipid-A-disaccharide synthase [Gallaecimonas kandeliae]|uniref:lipid-A-disaccharide synthase n=1 Tax=Gallaecimonas kandeliae TaxID=3029055 RepID=UPI002648B649|nr:lipid-A-disaccharide synthase [Gallaecimonas kandeliae]WKE64515.1 lipid-A-disaccharide synthase [Gallaecimonas kandeliae]
MALSRPLRIGIIAGEASGDLLGADLMAALQARHPEIQFEGIGGPRMQALGFHSHFDMEELSVMGLVEVLKHLPRLLSIRKQIVRHFIDNPPDVFIGIDAPDFNLGVERRLKEQGIKTVHYVSPSVWAWREKRVFKVKAATDLVLALLPFEKAFYDRHDHPCVFVGHPLADRMPLDVDVSGAWQALGLDESHPTLAVLPGSRGGEVARMAPLFKEVALRLKAQFPGLRFLIPAANAKRRAQIETVFAELPDTSVVDGQGREVMAASDAVLLASGTATLEAMLAKKPMVVAYQVHPFTYWLAKKLVRVKRFSLPNLLADADWVPELIQDDATPEAIAQAVAGALGEAQRENPARFRELHEQIRRNASERAAEAVLELTC